MRPFPEGFGVVAAAGKAGQLSDFGDGFVGILQKPKALIEPVLGQIGVWRLGNVAMEKPAALALPYSARPRDALEGDFLPIEALNVADHFLESQKIRALRGFWRGKVGVFQEKRPDFEKKRGNKKRRRLPFPDLKQAIQRRQKLALPGHGPESLRQGRL